MKYNKLGRTDISVSEICLGTMTWGTQNSEAEARDPWCRMVPGAVDRCDRDAIAAGTEDPLSDPAAEGDAVATGHAASRN